uniref:ESX-1 secretion-associated protein EspK-like n=1 Tax=Halichoerus grypus TaxID=9711 RepID=UPI0016593366|nr:ESX-1 secretion-associated protein EspK-like [Halichoerus grypus]
MGDPQGQWGPLGFGEVGAEPGLTHSRGTLPRGPWWLSPFSPACLSGLISGDRGAGGAPAWRPADPRTHWGHCSPVLGAKSTSTRGAPWPPVVDAVPGCLPGVTGPAPHSPRAPCFCSPHARHPGVQLRQDPVSHPRLLSHLSPSDNTQALPTGHHTGDLAPRSPQTTPAPSGPTRGKPAGSNSPGLRASEEQHLLGLGSPPARYQEGSAHHSMISVDSARCAAAQRRWRAWRSRRPHPPSRPAPALPRRPAACAGLPGACNPASAVRGRAALAELTHFEVHACWFPHNTRCMDAPHFVHLFTS